MKKIAIFASGSGSNAENIVEYFKESTDVSVSLIVCNKADAFVLERAKRLGIPSKVVTGKEMREQDAVMAARGCMATAFTKMS